MGIGSSSLLYPVMESVSARMGRKRKDAKLERIGSARSGRNLQVGIYVSSFIFGQEALKKFLLALMGVLAPGSAHARPSARPPIDTSGNLPVHMSAESPSNISPNPSEVISEVSEP